LKNGSLSFTWNLLDEITTKNGKVSLNSGE